MEKEPGIMVSLNTEGQRQRKTAVQPNGKIGISSTQLDDKEVAVGPVKHGGPMQALRIFLFGLYFGISSIWYVHH